MTNQGSAGTRRTLVHQDLTRKILGAAIEVHKALGPGLLESVYEACLCHELTLRNIAFKRQVPVPINYKGLSLECGYRSDLVVVDTVVLELKSIDAIIAVHEAQLLTYLKLLQKPVGFIINFNVVVLKDGIVRRVL